VLTESCPLRTLFGIAGNYKPPQKMFHIVLFRGPPGKRVQP